MKGSPLLSPKGSREAEEDPRFNLMKKKSPSKAYDDKDNSTTNGSNSSASYQYAKNDRNNRMELLLKNHAKCFTLNQMVLDMFRLEQDKSVYIAYYIFKSIEKELSGLNESLKKEAV